MVDKLVEIGKSLGLDGFELRQFVTEQQEIARAERAAEREAASKAAEREAVEKAAEREFELERLKLMSANDLITQNTNNAVGVGSFKDDRGPKIPCFIDGKDQLDGYLLRFERYASDNDWPRDRWASALSVLITGRALEVYSRLSDQDARNYDTLKKALLLRYHLTDEGYRKKFRTSRPEWDESPKQFIVRLEGYVRKWIELSDVDSTVNGIIELIIKEQFLNTCSPELATYLRTNPTSNLNDLSVIANNFIEAHGRKSFSQKEKEKSKNNNDFVTGQNETFKKRQDKCGNCGKHGHSTSDCWGKQRGDYRDNRERKCYFCSQVGHLANLCPRRKGEKASVAISVSDIGNRTRNSEMNAIAPTTKMESESDVSQSESTGHVKLASGEWIDIAESSCTIDRATQATKNMPVAFGLVNGQSVETLRDSGCNTVLIKRKFVLPDQFTGNFKFIRCVNNYLVKTPVAMIYIDTPYLTGRVEALCMKDAIYDLIIGNVQGAEKPNLEEGNYECETVTNKDIVRESFIKRNPSNKVVTENVLSDVKEVNLGVTVRDKTFENYLDIDRKNLALMQNEDTSLKSIIHRKGSWTKGRSVIKVIQEEEVWYREFFHPNWNRGNPVRQVLLPKEMRVTVMTVAHESTLGAHMGIGKTIDKIQSCFFWPGIHADVTRFINSCDTCQKTVNRGSIRKATLGRMPIIGTCWERIGVDLVGPITPKSERGHQYILTIVDYATRYPEAIPLTGCSTEDVADALFEIYCRLGIPNEMVSDLGKQFTSDCMSNIAKLLGVKQLKTSIHHPMTNGLTERYNGTMKLMLRRLCAEEPRQWDKYLGALLFAYREVPQESTGFSPFELLYGRTVRGPIQILKELWTQDITEAETKNSYQYVFELKEKLGKAFEIAHENLEKSHRKQSYYYNKGARDRSFEVGDEVLLMMPTDKNKLLMQWKGPYQVVKKKGTLDYEINVNGKYKTYHVNLLKPYIRRPLDLSIGSNDEQGMNANTVAVAVIDDCEEESIEEAGDLTDLPSCRSQETIHNVKIANDLSDVEKVELMNLLEKFQDVVTGIPGKCNLTEHKIQLTDDTPIASRPYPVPYNVRKTLDKEVQDMLDLGIVRPSQSNYASPVVIVKKKDGSNRICIDYRKLNKLTIKDPEPMPFIEDMFQNIGQDKYFSKLDLTKGYWQIAMAEEDIKKTAFVTHNAKLEFLRMPFGTKSAGATLMRCMRILLHGIQNVHNYIDDIMIHTKDWDEHLQTLEIVFLRLKEAGLTVKPSKCEFGFQHIEFVGHIIGHGKIEVSESNARKVSEARRPTTKKEVRAFVALVSFYRDFIPNFSEKAAALTDLTKNRSPNKVIWNNGAEQSYVTLRTALMNEPILHLYDETKPLILRTDASDIGLGAVLMQKYEDKLFPIKYASRKLLDRETRYATIEKECLAIVWAIKRFEMFLYGKTFTINTDHNSLTYIDKVKYENSRIMRWGMFLQQYSFHIEAIKGSENIEADYLSRVGW